MMKTPKGDDQYKDELTRKMIAPLRSSRFTSFPGHVWLKLLTSIASPSTQDLSDLQAPLTTLITLRPEFIVLMQSIHGLDYSEIVRECQNTIFLESMNSSVVHLILRKLINRNVALESALISLRRAHLQWVHRSPASVEPHHLQAMITIASQAFNNEYVFIQTGEEDELCNGLLLDLQSRESDACSFVATVAAYAMYHPLTSLALSKRQIEALSQHGEGMQELIDRQITDDRLERTLAARLASSGHIDNEISKKVRHQYEEAPYPRWLDMAFPERRAFDAYIKDIFPFLGEVPTEGTLHCLVAGCGTGKHALAVAARFLDCSVVALDLSRRSLSYGARQASRYGISNIQFVHADLLNATLLQREFDLIEAVGSLHHLEDTFSGIRALRAVLRPRGFMKIALYRRSMRDRLKPARDLAWSRLKTFSTSELQAIRHELLTQQTIDIELAKSFDDFYYTSGFRDLLCHIQERSFTPLDIKPMLEKLNLQFLGIDYAQFPAIQSAFREAHSIARGPLDLAIYEEFEASHAEQLPSLVEFWCQGI